MHKTQKIIKKALTKKKFSDWLSSKSPKTKVAPSCYSECSCPIANYINFNLKEYVDDIALSVNEFGIEFYDVVVGYTVLKTPKWVKRFINELDANPKGDFPSVSAQKALGVLNKIK